jgi:hypothetical protein
MNFFFKQLILRIALALLSAIIAWWQQRRSSHTGSSAYQHSPLSPTLYEQAQESTSCPKAASYAAPRHFDKS